jgi:hypothetical protein
VHLCTDSDLSAAKQSPTSYTSTRLNRRRRTARGTLSENGVPVHQNHLIEQPSTSLIFAPYMFEAR